MKKAAVLAALAVSLSTFLLFEAVNVARAADAAPRVHTVLIEGMRYQPEGLTVVAGDTVVWINRDMVPHTATSASGRFDSNEIAPGQIVDAYRPSHRRVRLHLHLPSADEGRLAGQVAGCPRPTHLRQVGRASRRDGHRVPRAGSARLSAATVVSGSR